MPSPTTAGKVYSAERTKGSHYQGFRAQIAGFGARNVQEVGMSSAVCTWPTTAQVTHVGAHSRYGHRIPAESCHGYFWA